MKILIIALIIIAIIGFWAYDQEYNSPWITEDMTNTIDVGGFR